jgi:multidrug resistance efflux pump
MAKKETVRNNLKPEEYWEWRAIIKDMEIAKQKLLNNQIQLKLLQKESELLTARIQLFGTGNVKSAEVALEQAKLDYDKYKSLLEEKVNQSLNNKAIDDITFEIKELPSNNN